MQNFKTLQQSTYFIFFYLIGQQSTYLSDSLVIPNPPRCLVFWIRIPLTEPRFRVGGRSSSLKLTILTICIFLTVYKFISSSIGTLAVINKCGQTKFMYSQFINFFSQFIISLVFVNVY